MARFSYISYDFLILLQKNLLCGKMLLVTWNKDSSFKNFLKGEL